MSFFETNESFAPGTQAAKIKTPGVHTNLKLVSVNLIDKKPTVAEGVEGQPGYKPAKNGYQAAEFTFENPAGEQHVEMFMQPVTDPSKVNAEKTMKWYQPVDGKMTHTRSSTVEEHIKLKNNEFMYFLIDLGEALGYSKDVLKTTLGKARDFADAVNIFKKSFPGTDKSRVNARIVWQNNDPFGNRKGSSFLKIYFKNFAMYYPFGDDMFEKYVEGRPATLRISDYDKDPTKAAVLTCKFPYERPAGPNTNDAVTTGDAGAQSALGQAGYGQQPQDISDDDPF